MLAGPVTSVAYTVRLSSYSRKIGVCLQTLARRCFWKRQMNPLFKILIQKRLQFYTGWPKMKTITNESSTRWVLTYATSRRSSTSLYFALMDILHVRAIHLDRGWRLIFPKYILHGTRNLDINRWISINRCTVPAILKLQTQFVTCILNDVWSRLSL